MGSASGLAFIVSIAGISFVSCAKSRGFERQIERRYCVPVDDDLGGNYFKYLSELESGGEAARIALLNVANSEGPARGCAISFVCELEDDRISPTLQKLLHQRASPPGTREYLEQHAALDCISKHGLTYPSYIEDLLGFIDEGGSLELRALRILGTVNDETVRRRLVDLLAEVAEEDTARRYPLVEAVGIQKAEKALATLERIAQQPDLDDAMRFQLTLALLRIQPASMVEVIRSLIDAMDNVYLRTGHGQHIVHVLRTIRIDLDRAGQVEDAERIELLIGHIENLLAV